MGGRKIRESGAKSKLEVARTAHRLKESSLLPV
jgi:hypothetical protein